MRRVADNLLTRILGLIEKGNVEQRCASLLVLGALKLNHSQIIPAVGRILEQTNPILKDYALRYFEEAQPKAAAPILLKILDDPDKEVQERTVRLLSRTGAAAIEPLLKRAAAASRPWQLNAARVLCAAKEKTARQGLLQMLLGGTDDFNKSVCDLMIPALREMDAKEQGLFHGELEAFARALDDKKQRPALVSAIRLLGQLGRPPSRRWLFQWIGPEHPAIVRSHALVALLRCLRERDLPKNECAALFRLLEEPEFTEISRLALELLDSHELPADSREPLSRLLESPHPDLQKFALRKMPAFSTPAIVRTLIDQLGDADYRRRDVAAGSLRKIPEARAALIKELLVCGEPSKAWSIAELLTTLEGKWRPETLDSLWKRLQTAVSAEDRIQTAYLHVLKKADPARAYDDLSAHGARLLKAKKYKEALAFLVLLKDFAELKAEHRFALALAQLKLHSHSVAANRHHPVIDMFADLHRSSTFPLFEALKKEKSLTPEEFFALGFHLVERAGDERHLGRNILEHVATRSPRTKIGKSAKNKLKLLNW